VRWPAGGRGKHFRRRAGGGYDPPRNPVRPWSSPIAPEAKKEAQTQKDAPPSDIAGLSFEAALGELEVIVARLEQGEVDLDDSIALYERGQGLKAHCEARLKAAEGRLEKVVQGGAASVPMDGA
jgi:exodeoxyribonuclease VII small subunit